jgi:hypothetical protein
MTPELPLSLADVSDYNPEPCPEQAEWAHRLAVEALWLDQPHYSHNGKEYVRRQSIYHQSLRAYNAEFNSTPSTNV